MTWRVMQQAQHHEGEETPPVVPATSTPSPTFVPSDDFKKFQETITGTLTGIQDAMSQITKSIGAPRVVTVGPGEKPVTDDEIDSALRTGEGGSGVLRRLLNEKASELRRTEIDPLRQSGFTAVQGIVQEQVKGFMPYYDRFRKEIDEYIQAMPDDAKLNPKVYIMAHNAVVGMHHKELADEAVEAAIRKASEPPKADAPPSSRSGRSTGAPGTGGIPDPEDVFGRDAMDALATLGRTPDQHAKSLGYKDYKDYYEKAMKETAA